MATVYRFWSLACLIVNVIVTSGLLTSDMMRITNNLKSSDVESSMTIERTRELLKYYEHAFHRSVLWAAVQFLT
jgi:hypothetical protein